MMHIVITKYLIGNSRLTGGGQKLEVQCQSQCSDPENGQVGHDDQNVGEASSAESSITGNQ